MSAKPPLKYMARPPRHPPGVGAPPATKGCRQGCQGFALRFPVPPRRGENRTRNKTALRGPNAGPCLTSAPAAAEAPEETTQTEVSAQEASPVPAQPTDDDEPDAAAAPAPGEAQETVGEAATPPVPDAVAAEGTPPGFEEQFARVVELQADAEFHEAMKLCRELRKQYRTGDEADRLGRKMAQLAEYARRSSNLPYAVRKLSSDSGHLERQVAREKLAEAGELGSLYLRRAIRNRTGDGIAEEAAEVLIYEEGPDCVPFLIEQLDPPPAPALLETLLKGIVQNVEGLPVPSLLALLEFTTHPGRRGLPEQTSARAAAGGGR